MTSTVCVPGRGRERITTVPASFTILVALVIQSALSAATVLAQPAVTLWDMAALRRPPQATWLDTEGPLRRLSYEGEPRAGKPTQVFAYCGFPAGATGKSPAMVLIHGGGGTAFPEWVKLWTDRGYVAIAMDLAGKGVGRQPLPDGGPDQSDDMKFPLTAQPLRDLWSYHAVAACVRAGSLLASLAEVDPDRIGVTGISWGGYLTCIVAGLDDRFKAAVPVYGCGFLADNSTWLSRFAAMDPQWKQTWIDNFDPSKHVGRAQMPMFFVNGTNDFAYPLDSYQKTYRLVGDRRLCVTVKMPHGHPQGWAPQEIGIFVDHQLRADKAGRQPEPLPAVAALAEISADGLTATIRGVTAKLPVVRFHWTSDAGPWQSRTWTTTETVLADGMASVTLPTARPLVGFFTLTDARGATVSCEYFELPVPATAAEKP
ncbi:MAG: alpha/beta fold hydrolase [Planctomycetota bacterium]